MRRQRRERVAVVGVLLAVAAFATGCGPGPSDDERRAQWEANEPHAYAYWFFWGAPEGGNYSVRVEIVGDEIVRTDLGPDSNPTFHGPDAPTIDDVFDLLDIARRQALAALDDGADIDVEFHELGFPDDVSFTGGIPDWEYGFGVAGFEVIEERRPDG